ncbi:MAG TPA: flagellar basal body L-ring protein FlgH [Opitutaceae bacterium]|nr:flagellar basal body L-ring protein FlgH [Opitutaceae bacterium]
MHRLTFGLLFLLPLAPVAHADSVWPSGSSRGMLADRRASRTGDIVTIIVQESVSSQNSQSSKADKASKADNAITQFLFPTTASLAGTHNGSLPGTGFDNSSSTASSGAISNKATLTSRAAVLVTDVLPNGNLVLEGVRQVAMGGERQYMVLRGIIRPEDISSNNTISSTSIANATLEVISEGSLTDTQGKGWLTKLYELLRLY